MDIRIDLEGTKFARRTRFERNEKGESFEEWLERAEKEKKELSREDIIEACAVASNTIFERTGEPLTILLGAIFSKELVGILFDKEEGEKDGSK